MKLCDKSRIYTKAETSRRSISKLYYLSNFDGIETRVCKTFFKKVLQISDGRIARVTAKKCSGNELSDKRGKHIPFNKTSDKEVEYVRNFILGFPTYQSHYSRSKNPHRLCLAPDLNITKMYEMMKDECKKETPSLKPVSLFVFRRLFSEDLNLHFHAPLQDTCKDIAFMAVDIGKKQRGRVRYFHGIELPALYPGGRQLSKVKLLDLKSLLPFIPPICHTFYKTLKMNTDKDDQDEAIWTDTDSE